MAYMETFLSGIELDNPSQEHTDDSSFEEIDINAESVLKFGDTDEITDEVGFNWLGIRFRSKRDFLKREFLTFHAETHNFIAEEDDVILNSPVYDKSYIPLYRNIFYWIFLV